MAHNHCVCVIRICIRTRLGFSETRRGRQGDLLSAVYRPHQLIGLLMRVLIKVRDLPFFTTDDLHSEKSKQATFYMFILHLNLCSLSVFLRWRWLHHQQRARYCIVTEDVSVVLIKMSDASVRQKQKPQSVSDSELTYWLTEDGYIIQSDGEIIHAGVVRYLRRLCGGEGGSHNTAAVTAA